MLASKKRTAVQKTGRLSAALLPELWPQLTEQERRSVISYMQHFGLCCQLPEAISPEPTYLVPSLLPPVKGGKPVWLPDAAHDHQLRIRFVHKDAEWEESHGFLPDTLFFRLISRLVQGARSVGDAFKDLYSDRVVMRGQQRFLVQSKRDGRRTCVLGYYNVRKKATSAKFNKALRNDTKKLQMLSLERCKSVPIL